MSRVGAGPGRHGRRSVVIGNHHKRSGHSQRACTHICSTCTCDDEEDDDDEDEDDEDGVVNGPTTSATYLRAGWSLGKVPDRYIFQTTGAVPAAALLAAEGEGPLQWGLVRRNLNI